MLKYSNVPYRYRSYELRFNPLLDIGLPSERRFRGAGSASVSMKFFFSLQYCFLALGVSYDKHEMYKSGDTLFLTRQDGPVYNSTTIIN